MRVLNCNSMVLLRRCTFRALFVGTASDDHDVIRSPRRRWPTTLKTTTSGCSRQPNCRAMAYIGKADDHLNSTSDPTPLGRSDDRVAQLHGQCRGHDDQTDSNGNYSFNTAGPWHLFGPRNLTPTGYYFEDAQPWADHQAARLPTSMISSGQITGLPIAIANGHELQFLGPTAGRYLGLRLLRCQSDRMALQ